MSESYTIQSSDLARDREWYIQKCGFKDNSDESYRLEENIIRFESSAQPEIAELKFQVEDLDEVFESMVVTGIATIERPPSMTFFGTKELKITDPNGHKLLFYQEI